MEDKPIVFKDYASMLWKYSWMIVLITLLFTTASAVMSFYVIKPIYQAQAEILVNEVNDEDEEHFINLDNQFDLMGTYIEILKSPRTVEGVEKELAKAGDMENLEQKVQIEGAEDALVIKIKVQNESPQKAAEIANIYAEYFQKDIQKLMKIDNVQLLSKAKSNYTPVNPNPFFIISIGFVLGIMISSLIVFLLGKPDRKTKNSDRG
ncbi:Wzz/FepE/Etk N-terminal domain-containing protein [Metabacillus idriensis]|uniref:YveK family protein n=1 Tax=Metabacillus idriensis TaxID=324768 RepID=UPI0008A83FCA|nr:Wzz/FepE/Etk N-terminal domain-containing protein [Metabacillus idriensis]MCM3596568.1 Wzz/FepE/Etk N-terminal domain-containing protein [Metabacillus idriensis]OHR68141.1 hypothetical protein HMPREF3291_09760 [Bacillus sp. HMSC76G11]